MEIKTKTVGGRAVTVLVVREAGLWKVKGKRSEVSYRYGEYGIYSPDQAVFTAVNCDGVR